jgi:hypothetical protein
MCFFLLNFLIKIFFWEEEEESNVFENERRCAIVSQQQKKKKKFEMINREWPASCAAPVDRHAWSNLNLLSYYI